MSGLGEEVPGVVLASASPRRLAILRSVGLEPDVAAASVDESPLPSEKPAELVERLALTKARSVAARRGQGTSRHELVIGADTVIDLDGQILGKPIDRPEGERMLSALAGRSHAVVTGVAVVGRVDGRPVELTAVDRTEVAMRPYDADEVAWYLDTGEFVDKAGAYAIQGFGSLLVHGIDGSYQGVVGLSLPTLDRLTTELGWPLRELMRR